MLSKSAISAITSVVLLAGSAALASGLNSGPLSGPLSGPNSAAVGTTPNQLNPLGLANSEELPLDPQINGRTLGTEAALATIIEQNRMGKPINWHVHDTVPDGPHKGEAIFTVNQRPIVILNGTAYEKQYHVSRGELLVANISHQNKMWIAKIPANAVDKLSFVLCKFMIGTGHGMIRFKFLDPMQLLAQIEDDGDTVKLTDLAKPMRLNDIFLSYEVSYSEKSPHYYDAKQGLFKTYASVFHFVSTQERAFNYFNTGQKEQQWFLNYDATEADLTLKEALVTSHVMGYSQMYNTLTKNCIRCALEVPDRAVGIKERKHTVLGRLAELLAVFNSRILLPEFFQRFVLLARGMRDASLDFKKLYLNEDPTLAADFQMERERKIQSLGNETLDQNALANLTKQLGPAFVRELRCSGVW